MRKIVIVHLSDFHYNHSEECQTIVEKLAKDISDMKALVNCYDFLVISGDCVDRGNVSLFEEFEAIIRCKIMKSMDITAKKNVIAVSGNHDKSHENEWLKKLDISNIPEANESIEGDMSVFFKEFNQFAKKYTIPENGIGVKTIKCGSNTVRFIMLNSSWSTFTKNEYGKLRIGDHQLEKLREELNKAKKTKKDVDLTIACMHHPLDWFTYEEREKIKRFLYGDAKVNFLLHGHIHEASYEVTSNTDDTTGIFCTGIAYNKAGENSSRKDGMRYSIYEIDFDTHTVNVHLRSTNKDLDFVGDNRLYKSVNTDGFFTIPLGKITDCLIPFKGAIRKNSVFTNREFVELLMHGEAELFKLYCGMDAWLEQELKKKKDDLRIWKLKNNVNRMTPEKMQEFEKSYYTEQFGYFVVTLLYTLNALFFKNHKDVRFLLRKYDANKNMHIVYVAEGCRSSLEEINKIKNFTWGEGMIYQSHKNSVALLKSQNLMHHQEGNSSGIWVEYLTIAINGIWANNKEEHIPLLALNIATESTENEKCMQALAMSSIYNKMQEIFQLFQRKTISLTELFK